MKEIIENICQLPVSLKKLNKCIYALLKVSCYYDSPDLVTESLKKNQEVINEWLIYSSDKRTSSGWYFKENDKHNKYIVGYLSSGNRCNETVFSNIVDACTMFIMREIEDIRKS